MAADADFSKIINEILQPLAGVDGTQFEVRVEVTAVDPTGFDEPKRRTVSENAETLRFEPPGGITTNDATRDARPSLVSTAKQLTHERHCRVGHCLMLVLCARAGLRRVGLAECRSG